MTYVVTEACIKCKYMDCVEVCPVDCFYEGENMLVINPDECIDCGVCEPECPPEAILPDTEKGMEQWLELNRRPVGRAGRTSPARVRRRPTPRVQGRCQTSSTKFFSDKPGAALDLSASQSFRASCAIAMQPSHGRPLPKCNIARDSSGNSVIKAGWKRSGVRSVAGSAPSRYPKATYRYRASGRARRGACAAGRGIAERGVESEGT